jgi:hypothetical protein
MNGALPIPVDYYTAQADKLLRQFDQAARHFRPVLVHHLAGELPDEIIGETRHEFERLLAAIPYIGGKRNSLTPILVSGTMALALYRVLKGRGRSVEEIGRIVVEIEESRMRAYPRLLVRLSGWVLHTPLGWRRLKGTMVERSQEHAYPGDWVATFVEGDGQTFDFGIDYTECALVKFFGEQGAGEFTRYLCLVDYIQQRAMGTGFFRSTTLAEGDERCDFRWKKGSDTRPAWPPPWQELPEEEVTG